MPSTRSNEDVSRIACIVRTTAAARFARADPSPPPLREISCRVGCMDLWRAHRGSEERVKAAERLFDDPVDLAATRRFLENDGLVKRLSCGDRRGRTEGSTGAPPERRHGTRPPPAPERTFRDRLPPCLPPRASAVCWSFSTPDGCVPDVPRGKAAGGSQAPLLRLSGQGKGRLSCLAPAFAKETARTETPQRVRTVSPVTGLIDRSIVFETFARPTTGGRVVREPPQGQRRRECNRERSRRADGSSAPEVQR
jgi:hypothetical protein